MSNPERDRFDDVPILAELRERLEGRFVRNRTGALGRVKAGLRLLPPAVASVAAVAVAVLALVALGHRHPGAGHQRPAVHHSVRLLPPSPHRPSPPSPAELRRQRAEQRYINAAQAQVAAHDPACRQRSNQGATFIHTGAPRELLSLLAVMRRPAPPSDASMRTLMNGGFDIGAGVYVKAIRRARIAYGKAYYLIPEARTTPFSAIPARCDGEIAGALEKRLRGAAPALRAATLRQEAGNLSVLHEETRHQAGLCFAVVSYRHKPGPNGVDMGCGQGFSELAHGGGLDNFESDRAHGRIMSGVVSDQVASVTFEFAAGAGDPARRITVRPVNNVIVIKVPPRTYHIGYPPTAILRTAAGKVIPPPATGTQVGSG